MRLSHEMLVFANHFLTAVNVESKAAAIQKESEPSISLHLKTAIEEMNNSTLGKFIV